MKKGNVRAVVPAGKSVAKNQGEVPGKIPSTSGGGDDEGKRLLTYEELAKAFRVSKPTVYLWVKRRCPYIALGVRRKVFEFEKVLAWLEQQSPSR
jgi:excisionase family DNA binding protein